MLIPCGGPAEKGTADWTLKSGPCLSLLNLVSKEVATGRKLFPIASMLPAIGFGARRLLRSDVTRILEKICHSFVQLIPVLRAALRLLYQQVVYAVVKEPDRVEKSLAVGA